LNERATAAQADVVNANAAGPSTVAGAGRVAIDQSQQGDFRAGQRGLAEQLSGVVNGTAPSVAQNQMRQAREQLEQGLRCEALPPRRGFPGQTTA